MSAVTVVNSVHPILPFSCYQDGWTALLCAANKGHATVVTELLKRGADINKSDEVRYYCTVAWT
jgi:Ankyrin repeat